MHAEQHKAPGNFFAIGVNYRKTDVAMRSEFAVSEEQYRRILARAKDQGINELFILSTCNRTELYGFAPQADQLIDLLCAETKGDALAFRERSYTKQDAAAIQHLFMVAAGLDSQLLGDYEIVGQLKKAVRFAKQEGSFGSFTERLINCALQASKNIKNQTQLSGGTVSVSFAAVQYLRENVRDIASKKILLLGIGKMGRNTAKNLSDYIGTSNITLINRSPEKAIELAKELRLRVASAHNMLEEIRRSDIILVATNATDPLIAPLDLKGQWNKLFIDLSIPCNVDPAVGNMNGISLVNVDELSKLNDHTLRQREAEVPKALAIIEEHMKEFMEWQDMRRHVPVLKAVKLKLREIHSDPLFLPLYQYQNSSFADQKIQRVINGMAFKMKTANQKGCHYIQAINEFIATGT